MGIIRVMRSLALVGRGSAAGVTRHAVSVDDTARVHRAARAGIGSPAIAAGLVGIAIVIAAVISDAHLAHCVARGTRAVERRVTMLAQAAPSTAVAAIDVELAEIRDPVRTVNRQAVRTAGEVAMARLTILVELAMKPFCAGRTRTTAIDVGFVAVDAVIRAVIGLAAVRRPSVAGVRRAIAIDVAIRRYRARRARTATINVRLVLSLLAVAARRWRQALVEHTMLARRAVTVGQARDAIALAITVLSLTRRAAVGSGDQVVADRVAARGIAVHARARAGRRWSIADVDHLQRVASAIARAGVTIRWRIPSRHGTPGDVGNTALPARAGGIGARTAQRQAIGFARAGIVPCAATRIQCAVARRTAKRSVAVIPAAARSANAGTAQR